MSPSREEVCDDLEEVLPDPTDLLDHLSVILADSSRDGAVCSKMCFILNIFLEQSALLDPVLLEIVSKLSTEALKPVAKTRYHLFTALYTVAKVRGPKHITRLLAHDPATFRALLNFLFATFPSSNGKPAVGHWQTHYFLLLWLSAAVLVPFPLATIVPEDAIDALYDHCLHALCAKNKISDGAAALLASFLTRKDTRKYLNDFVARCVSSNGTRGSRGPPCATALARIFKTGRRAELVEFVVPLVAVVNDLVDETETGGMKMKAKLIQRMALLYLKERPCTWRYDRGSRLVLFGQTRGPVSSSPGSNGVSSVMKNNFVGKIEDVGEKSVEETGWIEPIEEDIVEQAVQILLHGLRHRDTVVRWSAAKGIGRITGRLPREHAEDVVQAVVDLFTSPAMARADSAWHGGCLALAELARRGLILPQTDHFDALFRVAKTAAAFDIRRGAHSVGVHVRDAACYIVWALSRAYTTTDVAAHASAISETMIPVALLDREVNCRRAASAAIQECVGRLAGGVIADGIALVTLCDYFSLGSIISSYTKIAPQVASLAGGVYFNCILDEVWAGKLVHWDPNIRSLASRSLGALVKVDRDDVILQTVFPKLLGVSCQRGDAVHRHGAILGLAELTLAYGERLPDSLRDQLRMIPCKIKDKVYFRGKVGDAMCSAACVFVEACARAGIDLFSSTGEGRDAAEASLWILEHSLSTLSTAENAEDRKKVSVSAYRHLCYDVVARDPLWKTRVCERICHGMVNATLVEQQRGFALAASAIGPELGSPRLSVELMDVLVRHGDVEVRRNAAISLGCIAVFSDVALVTRIVLSLVAGMKDLTTDERGDVGSWVREASMKSFADLIEGMVSLPDGTSLELKQDLDSACLLAFKSAVTQSCGKVNRTRGVALSCLMRISRCLSRSDVARQVCLVNSGRVVASVGAVLIDSAEGGVFDSPGGIHALLDSRNLNEIARQLLSVQAVEEAALAGIIANCGGVSGGAAGTSQRWAADSVLEHSFKIKRSGSMQSLISLGDVIVKHIAGDSTRLVIPALAAFDYLVRYGVFSREECVGFLLKAVVCVRGVWKGHQREVLRVAAAVRTLGEVGVVRAKKEYSSCPMQAVHCACLEALVVVLAGPVPRLRRVSAEAIYMVLVEKRQLSSQSYAAAGDAAIALIADTPWETLSASEVRSTRNQLCKILNIKSPSPPKNVAPLDETTGVVT